MKKIFFSSGGRGGVSRVGEQRIHLKKKSFFFLFLRGGGGGGGKGGARASDVLKASKSKIWRGGGRGGRGEGAGVSEFFLI